VFKILREQAEVYTYSTIRKQNTDTRRRRTNKQKKKNQKKVYLFKDVFNYCDCSIDVENVLVDLL